MKSPFKFLDAFTLEDKDVFFGRDEEIATLYDMVTKNRLILVYGPSGTGKTSLIQCGLASRFDVTDWFPLLIRRKSDINVSLATELNLVLSGYEPENIGETILGIYAAFLRPVYLIFDQVEELFILGSEDERDQFAQNIRNILAANLPCRVILVIREEYLAHLYYVEKTIPALFDRRLRVEPMSTTKVKGVLEGSFKKFNITLERPKDKNFEQIIRNISGEHSGVHLPYLQVYLDMFWREDFKRTYPKLEEGQDITGKWLPIEITQKEIAAFGKIEKVLEKFLHQQQERIQLQINKRFPQKASEVVRQILDAFVSEEGTKRPVGYTLKGKSIVVEKRLKHHFKSIPAKVLNEVLSSLESARILRFSEQSIELAHDSLAALIERQRTDQERRVNNAQRDVIFCYERYRDGIGEYLTKKQLAAYEDLFDWMTLEKPVLQYINQSTNHRKEEDVKALEEAHRIAAEERKLRKQAEKAEQEAKRLAMEAEQQTRRALSNDLVYKASLIDNAISKWSNELINEIVIQANLIAPESVEGLQKVIKTITLNNRIRENIATSFRLLQIADSIYPENHNILQLLSDRYQDSTANLFRFEMIKDENRINAVAFSQDGQIIAIASADSTVKLLDFNTRNRVLDLTRHQWWVNAVAISPDANKVVTGSKDGTAVIWSTQSGKPLHVLDYTKLLNAADKTKDTLELQSVDTIFEDNIQAVHFSPDGKKVALASAEKNIATIWDADSGEFLSAISGHTDGLHSICFSPCGRNILTASWDNTAVVRNFERNEIILSVKNDVERINVAVYLPNGDLVAIGLQSGKIEIHPIENNKSKEEFSGHLNSILSISFTLDSQKFVSTDLTGVIKIWDKSTSQCLFTLFPNGSNSRHAAYSPDGKILVVTSMDSTISLYETAFFKKIYDLNDHTDAVLRAVFSSDGTKLISGSIDNTAKIWDLAYFHRAGVDLLTGHRGAINDVIFSPDGKTIATASSDSSIKIWDVKTKEEKYSFVNQDSSVHSISFSPNGSLLASASEDSTVKIWDIRNQNCLLTIPTGISTQWSGGGFRKTDEAGNPSVNNFSETDYKKERRIRTTFSKDGDTVFVPTNSLQIAAWDIVQKIESFTLGGHENQILGSALSPDGLKLVSFSEDNTAKVWDLKRKEELFSLIGHSSYVTEAAFSMDGSKIITVAKDGLAKIWDAEKGKLLVNFSCEPNGIIGCHLHPVLPILITVSESQILTKVNHSVRFWWLATNDLLEDVLNRYHFPFLSATQIEELGLESFFELAGITVDNLISKNQEEWMLNIADFYVSKVRIIGNEAIRNEYINKAKLLYLRLGEIGRLHPQDFYERRMDNLMKISEPFEVPQDIS